MKPDYNSKRAAIIAIAITFFAIISCKKKEAVIPVPPVREAPAQQLTTINLNDKALSRRGNVLIDMDGDGKWEVAFVTADFAYDDNTKSRCEYQIYSSPTTFLSIDTIAESTRPLQLGERITIANMPKHAWINYNSVPLMQEVSTQSSVYWEGSWAGASHQYLPVQLRKSGKVYFGWVEISGNIRDKQLVFHKAALSAVPDTEITAGR